MLLTAGTNGGTGSKTFKNYYRSTSTAYCANGLTLEDTDTITTTGAYYVKGFAADHKGVTWAVGPHINTTGYWWAFKWNSSTGNISRSINNSNSSGIRSEIGSTTSGSTKYLGTTAHYDYQGNIDGIMIWKAKAQNYIQLSLKIVPFTGSSDFTVASYGTIGSAITFNDSSPPDTDWDFSDCDHINISSIGSNYDTTTGSNFYTYHNFFFRGKDPFNYAWDGTSQTYNGFSFREEYTTTSSPTQQQFINPCIHDGTDFTYPGHRVFEFIKPGSFYYSSEWDDWEYVNTSTFGFDSSTRVEEGQCSLVSFHAPDVVAQGASNYNVTTYLGGGYYPAFITALFNDGSNNLEIETQNEGPYYGLYYVPQA